MKCSHSMPLLAAALALLLCPSAATHRRGTARRLGHPTERVPVRQVTGARIIGGRPARNPFTDSVVYIETKFWADSNTYSCTGTVLDAQHVLTAGHCAWLNRRYGFDVEWVKVNVGPRNDVGPFFQGAQVVVHRTYSPMTRQNDVAVIRIDGSFPRYTPVYLPLELDLSPRQAVFAAGFGATTKGGRRKSRQLLEVRLRYQRFARCVRAWLRDRIPEWSEESMICASDPMFPRGGRRDTCSGDSGGPLFIKAREDGERVMLQYGITSWGRTKCATRGKPSWYANVATFAVDIFAFGEDADLSAWDQVFP